MRVLTLLAVLAVMVAGCGGGESSSEEMVWCVGPGEVVDAEFKKEYPDLYIAKATCDAINGK